MECFFIVTALWVFSVCLHEFGHAWAADRGGDYTVRDKGYLNMNPLNYAHPVYSLLMPVVFMMMGGIGLPGGAVYINHNLLRSKGWETWVSLAGLAMNLAQIVLISAVFKFGLVQNDAGNLTSISLGFLLQLELGAFVLNLLPIPPLDGFQAIAPWLSAQHREKLFAVSNQALFILFIVLWYVEPVNMAFWNLVNWLTELLGVSPYVAYSGWEAFRFWTH